MVLKEFSLCILKKIRVNLDWLTRYGGEVFLVVLPETTLDGAACLAERIRQLISQCPVEWRGESIHFTAGFGVTGFDHTTLIKDISPDTLIREADRNLYQSKREGRNRVTTTLM
jgi:two-component system cell cycle response regulator